MVFLPALEVVMTVEEVVEMGEAHHDRHLHHQSPPPYPEKRIVTFLEAIYTCATVGSLKIYQPARSVSFE